MCVGLGIKDYFHNDPDGRCQSIAEVVRAGYTKVLRELFREENKVFQAKMVRNKLKADWLSAKEAAPILKDWQALVKKHDTFAQFSWDELDQVGAYDVQTLALVLDGPKTGRAFDLPDSPLQSAGITSLKSSLLNWNADWHKQVQCAHALHLFAKKHRMIIHSA